MSQFITRTLSAALALVLPSLAAAQTTEEEYHDPEVYQVEAKYPVVEYPDGYSLENNYSWESGHVYSPRYTYTPEEQEAIIADELRITGGRRSTDTDGAAVISIIQPTIPEATRDTSPPDVDVYEENGLPPPPQFQMQPQDFNKSLSPAYFSRRYYHKKTLGNPLFGASYFVDTFVKGTEASSTTAKKVQSYVENKVSATAFKATRDVIRARADVAGQGNNTSGTVRLYAMDQQVYSKNLSGTFSVAPFDMSRSFFKASKWFMVGPVPMKVTASLAGGVKLSLTGKVSATEAKLNMSPGGHVTATATAGVNIIIFSFGVEGNLKLINVTTPAIAELSWPDCSAAAYKLSAARTLNTMSGNIKLFAKVTLFWFIKKTWYLTIANWAGITVSDTLWSKSGSYALGICPGVAPSEPASLTALAAMP
ncbi:hypothetical protein POL68_32210 [Stigmatella sp. ncwal1]|uniref:Uncharacterized protein n=1 Tax=Stigmatella ashevillensis TaxID=2995309 RepID=A0ABT5DHN8_9BACT|nr:hypothetical protein [Stigmatella ashevillena]MDC0713170.1 hypothetical protein [Stigmatella ashevillena]